MQKIGERNYTESGTRRNQGITEIERKKMDYTQSRMKEESRITVRWEAKGLYTEQNEGGIKE
jgi:hypothetical protein